jgi:RimJ/RimL family protein N-acetyltransferase
MPSDIVIPDLATARLRLRAFRADDLDAFAAMQSNPEVVRHLGAGVTRSREETWRAMEGFLGQWVLRGYGMFAMQDAAGRFVGRAGVLHPLDWPEPELAYALDRPFWGIGLATEAATAIRDWAFTTFPFPRLASFIRPDNAASIRVVTKLGAVHEGTVTLHGGPAEHWVHYRPGSGPVV